MKPLYRSSMLTAYWYYSSTKNPSCSDVVDWIFFFCTQNFSILYIPRPCHSPMLPAKISILEACDLQRILMCWGGSHWRFYNSSGSVVQRSFQMRPMHSASPFCNSPAPICRMLLNAVLHNPWSRKERWLVWIHQCLVYVRSQDAPLRLAPTKTEP